MDYPPHLLIDHPELNFFSKVNRGTGEIQSHNERGEKIVPCQIAQYRNLKFSVYDTGTITLEGSLHVYWNSGLHNFNDFTFNDVLRVLDELKKKFNISPSQMKIRQLEIGVNISPPIPTNEVLDNLFSHKKIEFKDTYVYNEGKYLQCVHSNYFLKAYNKRIHYAKKGFRIDREILRFEIKYRGLANLKKHNIRTIQDLIECRLKPFKNELQQRFRECLFYDTSIISKSKRILNYSNPKWWKKYYLTERSSAYSKHKSHYRKLVEKDSEDIQSKIVEIIGCKFEDLT